MGPPLSESWFRQVGNGPVCQEAGPLARCDHDIAAADIFMLHNAESRGSDGEVRDSLQQLGEVPRNVQQHRRITYLLSFCRYEPLDL